MHSKSKWHFSFRSLNTIIFAFKSYLLFWNQTIQSNVRASILFVMEHIAIITF